MEILLTLNHRKRLMKYIFSKLHIQAFTQHNRLVFFSITPITPKSDKKLHLILIHLLLHCDRLNIDEFMRMLMFVIYEQGLGKSAGSLDNPLVSI